MEGILQKFNDAVSLVQKLPKDGPYKPSDNTRLRFYALYKQAMVGRNTTQQPSFMWDPVGRYKWKAWADLGDMRQGEAMQMYVSELKRLVSDIPETEDSLAFLSIFREKFQVEEGFKTLDRSEECVEVMESKTETDTEEYLDTVTKPVSDMKSKQQANLSQNAGPEDLDHSPENTLDISNTEHSSDSMQSSTRKKKRKQSKKNSDSFGSSEACSSDVRIIDVESQILRTLRLMRQDVRGLLKRMDTLENILARHLLSEQSRHNTLSSVWERRWLIFMVTWPVLTQIIGLWYVRRYYRKR
ncbi:hypothetical protein ACHWQZ_G013631 [Mnemiopsis leidyi]